MMAKISDNFLVHGINFKTKTPDWSQGRCPHSVHSVSMRIIGLKSSYLLAVPDYVFGEQISIKDVTLCKEETSKFYYSTSKLKTSRNYAI